MNKIFTDTVAQCKLKAKISEQYKVHQMKKNKKFKSTFLVAIMYFIQFFFSISTDTIVLRNLCYTIAAIVIKHMCALSEKNVFHFVSQVKTFLMKNKQTK